VVLLNKTIGEISAFSKTAVQLGFAALIILPYTLIAERGAVSAPDLSILLLLLLVGVLHTGIAYTLYFGSMGKLRAQTVALFSYLDPIVAILLSVLFLHEPMTLPSVVGAVLILGSTMVSEVTEGR
jgi:drug/metabolite transporter (DMT)-like permease